MIVSCLGLCTCATVLRRTCACVEFVGVLDTVSLFFCQLVVFCAKKKIIG